MLRSRIRRLPAASRAALCTALLLATAPALAGPYTDLGHAPAEMSAWATSVDAVVRGPQDINVPDSPPATLGAEANVLGAATGNSGDVLSLGDGGSITVHLSSGISNGPGNDFAVYENGFSDLFGLFAEFAYVEVASNGVDFVRFETHTVNTLPVGSFDTTDPTDYDGFAGRHAALLGTGFDLADLAFEPLVQDGTVDVLDVQYVRITDVIGDGSTFDDFGNPVYDPYATPFSSGGFDLEAVGVIHVPEPSFAIGLVAALVGLAFLASGPVRTRRGIAFAGLFGALAISSPALAAVAGFEDLGLPFDTFENGANLGGAGSFTSGGMDFDNTYYSWGGHAAFGYSSDTDDTTPGFGNQFGNVTGTGAAGSDTFGIWYSDPGRVRFGTETSVLGAYFTNTTYAYLSMLNGDPFAKQFGGPIGTDPDYFRLVIEGFDGTDASTGTVEFMLADFRNLGGTPDYIVDSWEWVDLTGLGANVASLGFHFESSDVGDFGINTPQYFAIDDLTTIPEPTTAVLLGLPWTAFTAWLLSIFSSSTSEPGSEPEA